MEAPPVDRMTGRSIAKASRRTALLDAAATLFAARGYNGVSIEDLGAAAGVSGPAVYRHFPGKPSVLSALLTGAGENLLTGGREVVGAASSPAGALGALIRFHVEFALTHPDVIRVHDRDLDALPDEDGRAVRSLRRSYLEIWVEQLAAHCRDADRPMLRSRVLAVLGLINSTPHTARGTDSGRLELLGDLLHDMAWAALTVRHPSDAGLVR